MKEDYRWTHNERKVSYNHTLKAMINYYGTFCGRWHSNDEWKQYKKLYEKGLTDGEAEKLVIEIEREADSRLLS